MPNNIYCQWREFDQEIKDTCKEVVQNIHQDILEIKQRYKELNEYGDECIGLAVGNSPFKDVYSIYYAYQYIPPEPVQYTPSPSGRLGEDGCRLAIGFCDGEPLVYTQRHKGYKFNNMDFYMSILVQTENDELQKEIFEIVEENIQSLYDLDLRWELKEQFWQRYEAFLMELYRAKNYKGAIEFLENSINEAKKNHGLEHTVTVYYMHQLAVTYAMIDKNRESEILHLNVLEIAERDPETDPFNLGLYKVNLARHYQLEGRFKEAEKLYKEGLAIWESISLSNKEEKKKAHFRKYYEEISSQLAE